MKRLFDLVLATLALLALMIPFVILILIVKKELGSPVFFRQIRPGLHGKPFEMIKLRTMTDERDANGDFLPDSVRLTKFGRFLRSSSLDELPELWNVLKGEMSLVGPRPLLVRYLPLYTAHQARRHEVRPGITGWAQVNGRNSISWEDRLDLDVWYVNNRSMMLDLRIIWLTIKKVIAREGISADGEATMSEFRGSTSSDHSSKRITH